MEGFVQSRGCRHAAQRAVLVRWLRGAMARVGTAQGDCALRARAPLRARGVRDEQARPRCGRVPLQPGRRCIREAGQGAQPMDGGRMTSHFDCSDAEGLRLGDEDDVECIHGIDLFAPCVKCKPMAANGGEENDNMMDPDKLMEQSNVLTGPWESMLATLLAQPPIRARDPKAPKPRARRSDAGKPRAPKEQPPAISDNSNALEAERKRAA